MTTGPAGRFRYGNRTYKRDDRGRFGSGSGATGQDALDAIPAGLNSLSDQELHSVSRYAAPGGHYRDVNGGLREGREPSAEARRTIADLDGVMARSTTTADIALHRGMGTGQGVFGERLKGDTTGLEWRENGFVSTSTRESMAHQFASDGPARGVVMRVSVPAGTGALKLGDKVSQSEGEVILQRGLRMRVTADNGIDPNGIRILDVEAVPE